MSDLQCAARVFLARHGEAEYESVLVTDDGGSLTARGREQARELGQTLGAERIARVYTSPMSRAVQTAEISAAVLGVDVIVREGLREYGVGVLAGSTVDEAAYVSAVYDAWAGGDEGAGIEGGERLTEIAARVTGVLDEVADLHRGETVLVVGHGGALLAALAKLAGPTGPTGPGRPAPLAGDLAWEPCALIELAGDADGWRFVDRPTPDEVR